HHGDIITAELRAYLGIILHGGVVARQDALDGSLDTQMPCGHAEQSRDGEVPQYDCAREADQQLGGIAHRSPGLYRSGPTAPTLLAGHGPSGFWTIIGCGCGCECLLGARRAPKTNRGRRTENRTASLPAGRFMRAVGVV